MPDFVAIDDFQHVHACPIVCSAEPRHHVRRHIEPSRLQNERRDRQPCKNAAFGGLRRLPEAVMGRQVSISARKGGEAVANKPEMARFIVPDL